MFEYYYGIIIAAFVVSLIIVLIMRSKMKSVKQKKTACDYVSSFDLTLMTDTFLYSRTTRVRKQSKR